MSWIKRKNVQELLTVGLTTYANDERFQAIHFHHSEDWTLQIKYVQPRDAGLYQCQVSTHPPTSIFLFLEVVGKRDIKHRYKLFACGLCPHFRLSRVTHRPPCRSGFFHVFSFFLFFFVFSTRFSSRISNHHNNRDNLTRFPDRTSSIN